MTAMIVDTSHSEIAFTVRHMMFAKVRGVFKSWSATLDHDPSDPTKTAVQVEINTASIDTGDEKRDAHLRSDDFFSAEKFPKITFKAKRVQSAGDGAYKVVGDLTLRGVTKETTVDVHSTGNGVDPWGNQRYGFGAKAAINRSEWGLKWNQALETGGVLVSDKVEIEAEVQVIDKK
ncbi:MAG: YceI family protein [Myxococcota bacterium]|nr:YceI family protein [Myxococcota bacterium]